MNNFLQKYQELGFSFFNTGSKEKKVRVPWVKWTTTHPTNKDIDVWSRYSSQNYAIVCGEISNLVVFDVDTKNGGDPTPFLNRGLYEVRTPSGGYHFYTTYDPLFARTRHEKADGILKGIDIQSNGALVFAAPSAFPKGTYTITNDIPITPLPPDLLSLVLDSLEPEKEEYQYTPYTPTKNALGGRPGDIFNALATWEDILLPLGWVRVGPPRNDKQYWKRPGKTDEGISASTNWKGYDLFFPYTKAVDNLEQKKGYTKFSLLAALKYNNDYAKTAKSLVIENYRLVNKLV
jgi:hypothetical protein